MQVSPDFFSFVFDLPSKLRVVHIRKNLKCSFSQKWLHEILWIHCKFEPQLYDTIGYSRKISETKKKVLIFHQSPNVATKPTDQSCSNSIFRIHLQISPGHFYFRRTLKIKGSLHNKQAYELSNKHGILQT